MLRRVEPKHIGLAGLLMAVTFSLCGCLYLRLNTVRNQLADFDRYVTVGGEPDLALTFKRPVLWSEDVETLFKQPPTEQHEDGAVKTCLWVLEKEPGAAAEKLAAFRFTFTMLFTSNKLSRLVIPREVLQVVPREAALGMIKAMGQARISTGRRSAATKFPGASAAAGKFVCDTNDVTRLLGAPHRTQPDGPITTWHYRFVLRPPPNHPAPGMKVLAGFDFQNTDGCLTSAQIEFSGHQVKMKM
jgi:hypothetical protein